MKAILIFITAILIFACNRNSAQKETYTSDSVKSVDSAQLRIADAGYNETDEENTTDTFYVVVTDTGQNYFRLRNQMLRLNQSFNIPIDTMGRYYNTAKNEIVLRENDEDELYRGEYFPRRFPSDYLSLEYLTVYRDGTAPKTIALVSGIYETRHPADSARKVLLKTAPKTFVLQSAIYTGCMH